MEGIEATVQEELPTVLNFAKKMFLEDSDRELLSLGLFNVYVHSKNVQGYTIEKSGEELKYFEHILEGEEVTKREITTQDIIYGEYAEAIASNLLPRVTEYLIRRLCRTFEKQRKDALDLFTHSSTDYSFVRDKKRISVKRGQQLITVNELISSLEDSDLAFAAYMGIKEHFTTN